MARSCHPPELPLQPDSLINTTMLTASQCRAARALLNWSQPDLAKHAGVHVQTISAFEKDHGSPSKNTLQKITNALEYEGIEFQGTNGVRLNQSDTQTLRGEDGFRTFSYDVYQTLQHDDREVLQAYVDDKKYARWLKTEATPHIDRMETFKKKNYRILQQEDDIYFPAINYAEYRWIPKKQFLPVPFMVYGDKMAIMLFEPEPVIIVNNYPKIAQAYRLQFETLWERAIIPPADAFENWQKNRDKILQTIRKENAC